MTWPDCDIATALNVSEARAVRIRALQPLVRGAAELAGISPSLVNAVVWVESRFNQHAVSGAGAQGYMQLMPATYRWLHRKYGGSTDVFDPYTNLRLGALFLRRLRDKYEGRGEDWWITAYNAGPGNVDKHGPGQWLGYTRAVQRARANFIAAAERCEGMDVPAPRWGKTVKPSAPPRPGRPVPRPSPPGTVQPPSGGAGIGLLLAAVVFMGGGGKSFDW